MDFDAAVAWLEQEARRLIRASRCLMDDGTAAFPPQVGLGYNAFWLRDYSYMVETCAEAITDAELTAACPLFRPRSANCSSLSPASSRAAVGVAACDGFRAEARRASACATRSRWPPA